MAEVSRINPRNRYGVGYKVYKDVVSVANGDTVTLPGKVLDAYAQATVSGHWATVTAINGNEITIGLAAVDLSAGTASAVTTAEDVKIAVLIATE